MTNVKTTFDASTIMREISKFAPFLLLACAFLSFFAVAIFIVDYYNQLFEIRFSEYSFFIAVMVALIQEFVRFGLLISSIRDFTDSRRFNGWLGLVGSIGLVMHDVSIVKDLAMTWDYQNPSPYVSVLVFLILIGLLLEIRLILTISKNKEVKPKKAYSQNGNSVKTADVQWHKE